MDLEEVVTTVATTTTTTTSTEAITTSLPPELEMELELEQEAAKRLQDQMAEAVPQLQPEAIAAIVVALVVALAAAILALIAYQRSSMFCWSAQNLFDFSLEAKFCEIDALIIDCVIEYMDWFHEIFSSESTQQCEHFLIFLTLRFYVKPKSAILTHLKALNFDFNEFLHFLKAENNQIIKI